MTVNFANLQKCLKISGTWDIGYINSSIKLSENLEQ